MSSIFVSIPRQPFSTISAFTSVIVGRLGIAPMRDTVIAAVWLANASACRSSSPAVSPVQNAATNESPAAVVSMI